MVIWSLTQGGGNGSPGGLDFLLFFAYAGFVANTQTCRVSFTDSEGIMHAVQVPAASLFEAAALAVSSSRDLIPPDERYSG